MAIRAPDGANNVGCEKYEIDPECGNYEAIVERS